MNAPQPAPPLDAVFPARPGHASEIRRAVTDAATRFGADETVLGHIALAVSEAVTNAILHAYRDRGDPDWIVRVMVEKAGGCLDISVCDRGIGLTPRADSPGLGLGLGLMAHEADECVIRAVPGGGTEVALRFVLT